MIDASTRLRRAILLSDALLVKRIIRSNPALIQNPDLQDKSNTSLHLAAQAGFGEIVELLVDAGHEDAETSRNADWDTPLMLAARHGNVEVGFLLASRFPRSIPITNKAGLDALALACLNPASTPLVSLLLSHPEYPAPADGRDNHGDTPLHHASASGSLKALRILLSAGADPTAKNAYDWTPLAYSQTVAAEVYFKNLVSDLERRKVEGIRGEKERREEAMKRKYAGVRLVTDENETASRPSDDMSRSESSNSISSPVDQRGGFTPTSITPTVAKNNPWVNGGFETRARAWSGD
ncbi:ankyrin [Aureobasidium subglaciale]|nr:ankyrin [Aureobasidium subglaciale]